jgi:hypothetical protein
VCVCVEGVGGSIQGGLVWTLTRSLWSTTVGSLGHEERRAEGVSAPRLSP